MRLGDAHIYIRISQLGEYLITVDYNVINGARVESKLWGPYPYKRDGQSADVLSELAFLLANVGQDISL